MHRILTLFITNAICVALMGQGFSPSDLLSQSSIHQWTGDNGLVSNNVTGSIQAKSGFIWITTYNGIMRFDGNAVDVFDRQNIPFLLTDAFYKVYEDKQGTLWFASQGSGVVRYKNGKFDPIHQEKLPKSIRCLFLDEDGSVWAGSNNEGLFRLHGTEYIEPVHMEIFKGKFVLDITRFNNSIWVATEGDGVYEINGSEIRNFTEKDGLYNDVVNTLSVTSTGTLLIGTSAGLNAFSKGKLLKYDFSKDTRINFVTTDSNNRVWVGSEIGLGRIDSKRQVYEFIGEDDGYPLARINSINFDNEGSAWIATGRDGLVQIKQPKLITLTTRTGLSMDRTNVVTETDDHSFYIGSDGGHVNVYRHGKVENVQLKTPLNKAGIRDICIDETGTMWIASYKGLIQKTKTSERLFTQKDGLPAIDIRRILRDANNNLWIGSRSGGVIKFKNGKILEQYDKNHGMQANYVLALEVDSLGNIYVGTHSGGMTIIKKDGTTQTFNISKDDSGVLIFNIHLTKNGEAMLVTSMGLLKFNGSTFQQLMLDHSIKGETYFDWIEDGNGDVWITSNVGIMKVKRNDLNQYLIGKLPHLPTRLFDKQDGMKNKECTPTRSIVSASGKIWIPTIGGVAVFYPELIKNNPIVPPVYIKRLVTDSKTFYADSGAVKSDNLRYIFHYTALSYLSPSKVYFKYKLEGVDPDWVETRSARQTEYTNLKPGDYTFRVIACNNDGIWNEQGAAMHFTVDPFFYQTTWFYASLILLVLIIFYISYKWRVFRVEQRNAELRKLNSELDKFVYSTSHDLRAPLASILGLVNLYRVEESNKDQYINLIEKSVKKLDEFINEIIDYSRNARLEVEPTEIDFADLFTSAIEELEYLDIENKISKTTSVNGTDSFFGDKTRMAIIVNNLLSNAIKYYNPNNSHPSIKIAVTYNAAQATIQVIDNGIGISSEQLENIFKMFFRGSERSKGSGLGLYIVKETVEKLGGTITVESTVDKGSTFQVVLPSLKK
jgi:signal transduction histidine kinase/ligand-binding sensor domain-containing protein